MQTIEDLLNQDLQDPAVKFKIRKQILRSLEDLEDLIKKDLIDLGEYKIRKNELNQLYQEVFHL